MKKYFITSTGTEIGKTYYVCKLIAELKQQGKSIKALKPVITGLDFNDLNDCDSAKILETLDKPVTKDNILDISPFYYNIPASPDSAAILEGKEFLDYQKIKNHCQEFLNKEDSDYALIEGIGGVMVPLNQDKTILDLMEDLEIEVILIVGNYLGTRSHSLSAIESCRSRNIKINKIVINDYNSDGESADAVKASLANFCSEKIEMIS